MSDLDVYVPIIKSFILSPLMSLLSRTEMGELPLLLITKPVMPLMLEKYGFNQELSEAELCWLVRVIGIACVATGFNRWLHKQNPLTGVGLILGFSGRFQRAARDFFLLPSKSNELWVGIKNT